MAAPSIRETTEADRDALARLYAAAFPDQDLTGLVRALLGLDGGVLSLVAEDGPSIAGHIVFTLCGVDDEPGVAVLLGPLAVAPERQRQGIGGALIRDGIRRLDTGTVAQVLVLGNPAYYGRFGFEPERAILTPCPIPEVWRDAWQSMRLAGRSRRKGRLAVPPPWRHPELWTE